MTALKVILVDDEQDSLNVLELMLTKLDSELEILAKCDSVDDAILAINATPPDLIFLDIEMPGKDGFELLKAFDDVQFRVIVVTGYEQYALRAIKFAAIDYLLKPVDINELDEALSKVRLLDESTDERVKHLSQILTSKNSAPDKLILPHSKGFQTIQLQSIVYLESQPGGYCFFHLNNGTSTLASNPMSYFEEILPHEFFCRVHRSHIVNLNFVRNYNSAGYLVLEDGKQLDVSVRRRSEFQNSMRHFASSGR